MDCRNAKLIKCLFILLLFSSGISISDPTFRSIAGYDINVDPSFSIVINNIIVSGQQIFPNSIVCIAPVVVNTTISSNFVISSASVECPTYDCKAYLPSDIPSSIPPFTTLWKNATAYDSVINYYCSESSYCTIFYSNTAAAGINELAPYVFNASYYQAANNRGIHPANGSLFCKGNMTIFDNGAIVSDATSDIGISSNVTFMPSVGVHSIQVQLKTANCSFMARSYEKERSWYGELISPVRDTIHFYVGGTYIATAMSAPINITFVNGPNLSVSKIETYEVRSGDTFVIKAVLNNTGVMNATINSITLSDGFKVISFTPNKVNAGQSVDLTISTKAPESEGTYNVRMTIDYTSDTPVIGTCGAGTTEAMLVANVTVLPPVPPPAVSIKLNASPYFVIKTDGVYFSKSTKVYDINATGVVTRDWPEGDNKVGSLDVNMSVKRFANGQWNTVRYYLYTSPGSFSLQPSLYCSAWTQECNEYSSALLNVNSPRNDLTIIKLRQPITYPEGFAGCSNSWPCSNPWSSGVYSITASIYDTLNKSTQTSIVYFVILSLGCKDYT